MRDIVEQAENVTLTVTSEVNIENGRTAQFHFVGPGGGFSKQHINLKEGEVTWVHFAVKLEDGKVVLA